MANNGKSKIMVKYVVIVLGLMLIGGAGMYGLAKHRQTTYYTAERSMVISHSIHEESASNNNFNSDDQQMMPTYKNISQDIMIAKAARKYLPQNLKKKYTAEKINETVDSKISQQSLMLTMHSKADSKTAAVATVNAMAKAMKKELPSIQPGSGQVRLLAPATKDQAEKVTTPHAKKYVAVGLALGAMVGLVICFVEETWSRLL
ncbi:chain-length determining protein [Limosilactobacillus oris]|uniref:chain-length determining protein n=1 Tax=Limosilactobacillus oris TaxID=1632 RepID=UPI00242E5BBB|nr:chain-length determining protein [Limosilactobacillus oris]